MPDDNTIDIVDRLPPIEVRKPWRHVLPSYYAQNIDKLKQNCEAIRSVAAVLTSIRDAFPHDDVSGPYSIFEVECAAKSLSEAIVLLECAKDKLWQTVPVEEFMSAEELREIGRAK